MSPNKKSSTRKIGEAPATEPTSAPGEATSLLPLVVGIGASAGAQEALEQIFTALPPDCGLSYVVIMHIPLTGPSFLAEMLGRYSTMPVVTAEDGMTLLPDRVQVIPAGHGIIVQNGVLRLEAPELDGVRHPVDRFFETLAAEAKHHAIAVLLSGCGTDGSKGVKAIRESGGTVIVQDPAAALYPDMPRNAIASGAVEHVLPPEAIAAKISEIAVKTCPIDPPACQVMSFDEELAAIFASVKSRTGHDFSAYKTNTVMRRIERRMAVHEVSGIRKYVSLLKETPQEASALAQDILIGVTGFFRDPEAFSTIEREIIPRLFADCNPEEPVRIWHACCATGEEVYSMAFLIREYLDRQGSHAKVQIFATDIDETSIAQARAGLYPDGIEDEVGAERLKAFFLRRDKRWQVVKPIREMIVFAHHSVIKNPPFSRLDLLVCRNFMIYLNPDMQNRLTSMFHQVLKPGKFLFLGSSETVGRNTDLFALIDKKWKIFARTAGKRRSDALIPFSTPVRYLPGAMHSSKSAEVVERGPAAVAERLLLERYSPPCVIVNGKYEVVHVTSRMNRFLEIPLGEPSRDILRMAREELRPALRAAIHKAFAEDRRVEFRGLNVNADGVETTVNLLVEPLEETHATGKLAMVIFETTSSPAMAAVSSDGDATPSGDEASAAMLVRQLEEQLRITHEQLQATTEQLESSNEGFLSANEELISMNEEFQSANEELQSTNEELETSKEELQALNEELVTVNAELQEKVEELNEATSDMENLLASSGIATLFLDRELHIKGFTPATAAIFNLIPADIGRPFRHLAGKIDWSTLTHDAETVLAGQPFAEVEITTLKAGQCYLKRIFPYRTQEGRVDGIVVSFIDITKRKQVEAALAESVERVRHKLENIISPEGDIGNLDLADIIDAPSLQALMDDFYQLTGMAMALIDIKGQVLVGVGWQDVCTKFHRINQKTCSGCIDSDIQLSAGIPPGEYKVYKCKNNMWDVATPLMVGGRHFGNLFMGQFFFADEAIDYDLFRAQAEDCGFDEKAYFAALDAVPRMSRETLNTSMNFFMKLADLLSKLSYSNLKLARSLADRVALMESLREREEQLRLFIRHAPAALAMFDINMRYLNVSRRWLSDYDLDGRDLIGESHYDVFPEISAEWREAHRRGLAGEVVRSDGERSERADGSVQWIRWEIRPWKDAAGKIGGIVIFADDITEFRKAEEILRRYEILAGNSRDIIFFMRRDDGRILEANTAAVSTYGYDHQELLGMTVSELRAPESLALTAAQMVEADSHGILFETVHRRKDGSTFPVEVSSQGATIDGTRTLISVIRDISERKRGEESLRESELFYRQTLESIPGMVFTTRPDGYCDYQSQQWVDFTGVPMVEHLGDGWHKLLHPEDRPRAFAAWQAAVEERAPYDLEYRVRRQDGEYEWFKVRGRPIRNVAGEIVRWFGIALDIDQLVKTEEELRQAKEEWELTFNSVPDLIAILNERHQVVRVNKVMAERLGREPAECVGMPCYEAIHGSDVPPEFCPHSRTMDDGGAHNVELYEERLGGAYLITTTPLLNLQGRMTGTVHVARDISERKRVEKELRRAKEAAEAATQTKSQFLANMSHELRSPMTGVLGMLELALAGNLETQQRKYIAMAQTSARSLVRILNDILDLTKIEMGKLLLEEKPFAIRKCLASTFHLFLPVAKSKGLDLSFTVADEVPETLVGDQTRLSQILTNLAGNAVKFTAKGKVEIRITAGGSASGDKQEVTFTVTDTGIGIPDDKKDLLFQVFSQVDESHSREYGGTGLGLAISKEIVERMGGTITFTSAAGRGSTFSFTIPLGVVEAGRAAGFVSGETVPTGDAPGTAERTKPRLLIAEDDQIIQQILGALLQRAHYEIAFADNGEKVVEMWEFGEYDLILMDVQMPHLNGFEATAAIRERERSRGGHIPIIAMTAHAFKEDEERCLAAGMDSYISKPIDFQKALRVIEEIIQQKSSGGDH